MGAVRAASPRAGGEQEGEGGGVFDPRKKKRKKRVPRGSSLPRPFPRALCSWQSFPVSGCLRPLHLCNSTFLAVLGRVIWGITVVVNAVTSKCRHESGSADPAELSLLIRWWFLSWLSSGGYRVELS